MTTLGVVLLFVLTSSVSEGNAAAALPSALSSIVLDHFGSIGSCNAYFCTADDASSFKREISSSSTLFKTTVISTRNERISLDSSQHRLGIFVDTNCKGGIALLHQNTGAFNSSYSWLLWSKTSVQLLETLKSSRLDVDSDLTILTEDTTTSERIDTFNTSSSDSRIIELFAMIDVHRKHRSSPFIMEKYQLWVGNSVQSILPISDREDLGKLQLVGSAWLPNMDIRQSSKDLLMDPAYSSNVDVKWRYGISLFFTICRYYLNCTVDLLQANCNDETSAIPCNGSAGVIDQVSNGMADFGIVPFTWDHKYDDIDYSLPIMNIKHKYIFLRPKMIGSYAALLLPLSTEIWLLLFGLQILSVVAFRAVSSFEDESSRHNDGWSGCVFLFIAALAQQGIPDNAGKLTTRIIYICVLSVTYFVYVYYSTALLNGLLLPPPHLISFPRQLFDSHLAIGLEESLILRARMEQCATGDEGLRDKLSGNSESVTFMEAVTGVERTVHEPFAIFGDELALYKELWKVNFTFAETCSIGFVDDEQLPRQASFVLQANSPYKEILRRGVVRSRERGAMHRLKTEWFPEPPECLWKTDALQFGLQPHAVAYVIMAFGVVASVIIFGGEKICHAPKRLESSKPKSNLDLVKSHLE